MLLTIASAFFFTEIKTGAFRKLFSGLVQELWIKWELQGMVILSLLLQFLLVWLGYHRRHQVKRCPHFFAILVWLTYLAADWVATVALSALLKVEVQELNRELVVFWTPFLLLHLGGPNTISAYSLTDNELWLRYLLGFVIQLGVAFYVYVKFRTNNTTLAYMAIPIFIAGIIKYGERIWILRAASYKQYSNSVFSSTSRNTARSPDNIRTNDSTSNYHPQTLDEYLRDKKVTEEGKSFHKAFYLCKMNIPLFSELKLRVYGDLRNNFMLFHSISTEDAFPIVQIELGFLHDMLYTKTNVLQPTRNKILIQSICLLSTFAALIAFSITVGNHSYPTVDICITYFLLGGAILVDISSAILHALSDWAMLCLSIPSNSVHKFVGSTIASKVVVHFKAKKKGIVYMAQHSLIDYCLKVKTSCWFSIFTAIDTEDILGRFYCTSWEKVNPNLKNFIHSHLQEKFKRYQNIKEEEPGKNIEEKYEKFDHELLLSILKERGDRVLQGEQIFKNKLKWSINDVEFSHSILLWHIATFLLFYDDRRRYSSSVLGSYCQISKLLSDYMMYLLLVRPLMLPKGIGEVRIRDTRKQVIRFFHDVESINNNNGAASALLHMDNELASIHGKSVLRDSRKLASELKELVVDLEDKWEIIAKVWMEMLAHAASKCRWKHHETQLRHGGELLTHVALFMAHLGLTEQMRIVQQPSDEGQSLKWDWEQLSHMSDFLA